MSGENNADHSYRISYLVCGIFLVGFILVTWAVVSDAHHRAGLEETINIATATPSP
jgi:hypothetical protein